MKALHTILAKVMVASLTAAAAPLTPGNIVVIDPFFLGQSLLEYRPDGYLVQSITIPQPVDAGTAGGMVFDDQNLLWIYNGTWSPSLTSWDSQSDTWTHRSFAGWNSFLCFPCQGIGAFGNFIFATDEGAFGNPNGLIRFDRGNTNNCVRFADGRNYSALAVGLDGILYGRRADDVDPPPPTVIDAFDPITLSLIRSVTLSDRSLSISADAQGQLYGASGQSILRYGADGTLLDTHQVITSGDLYTMALSQNHRFVVVSSHGEVVIADSSFIPQNRLRILTGSQAYAAIVPPPRVRDGDGDGVPDDQDQCLGTPLGCVVDAHGCSIDQLVPCAGPLSGGSWKNHGQYVSAVAKTIEAFLAAGRLSQEESEIVVRMAAQSSCGKKTVTLPPREKVNTKELKRPGVRVFSGTVR